MNTKIILIAILLLGFLLRFHNYSTWPREGATFDEYAWVWLGMNLIQKGIPISWSPHPQYNIRTHYVSPGGARFWLVQPYLEHPPFFGLIAGGYALIRGIPNMYEIHISIIRELAIILGVVSIAFVYILASSLYGRIVGLFSSLIYAVVPSVVIGSRILQNENFFIPIFLIILYLVKLYIDHKKNSLLIVIGLMCGLVSLAKAPWIAAWISVMCILGYKHKWKEAGIITGITLIIFSIFVVYGFYWDKELFLSLWRLQMNRYDMLFDSIFALATQPFLVDRYYLDGWIYAGWIAYAVLLLSDIKRNYILIFGLLGYFLVYIIAIPNEPSHGWYRYPFYPFLIIAFAVYLRDHARNFLLTPLLLLGIMLTLLSHTWTQILGFSFIAYRITIIWFAVNALPLWFPSRKMIIFSRWNSLLQISALFILSISSILLYNEQ